MKIRDFILGKCTTEKPTVEQVKDEAKHYWRHPFEKVDVPGRNSIFYRVYFILGFPPGWKLGFFSHHDIDYAPPHNHAGRLLSFIIRGGYIEDRIDGGAGGEMKRVFRKPFSFNWIPTDSYHAIRELPKRKALTLVVLFPTIQRTHYAVDKTSIEIKEYWRQVVKYNTPTQ